MRASTCLPTRLLPPSGESCHARWACVLPRDPLASAIGLTFVLVACRCRLAANFVPGCYALRVKGTLPTQYQVILEDNGIRYRSLDEGDQAS